MLLENEKKALSVKSYKMLSSYTNFIVFIKYFQSLNNFLKPAFFGEIKFIENVKKNLSVINNKKLNSYSNLTITIN